MRKGDGLVFSSLASLLQLRAQVPTLHLAKRQALARQGGMRRSIFKGRGMDFAESRLYQPGDDVRTIDWRVTARSGKVHTKVFQEEREKPVLIWVDLRSSMFFATRGRFKSVIAAEIASLLVWKTLAEGDRAGGLIQVNEQHLEFKPARSRAAALGLLGALAEATQLEPVRSAPVVPDGSYDGLYESWQRLRRVVEPGAEVFVISDFRQVDPKALQPLAMIHKQARLTLISIRDPIEQQLPPISQLQAGQLRVSDGQQGLWVNLKNRLWREQYQQRCQQQQQQLVDFSHKYRLSLVQLVTTEQPLERLAKLSRGLR